MQYQTKLNHPISFYIILNNTILHHIILYCDTIYSTIHSVLFCSILLYSIPFYSILQYTILLFTSLRPLCALCVISSNSSPPLHSSITRYTVRDPKKTSLSFIIFGWSTSCQVANRKIGDRGEKGSQGNERRKNRGSQGWDGDKRNGRGWSLITEKTSRIESKWIKSKVETARERKRGREEDLPNQMTKW